MNSILSSVFMTLIITADPVSSPTLIETRQLCGISCVAATAQWFGNPTPSDELVSTFPELLRPISLAELGSALEVLGFSVIPMDNVRDCNTILIPDTVAILFVSPSHNEPPDHFVILLGKINGQFVLADPAEGLRSVSESTMHAIFSGTALLACERGTVERAREHLNFSRDRSTAIKEFLIYFGASILLCSLGIHLWKVGVRNGV